MLKQQTSPLLLILTVVFVSFLLMSNILANCMIDFLGLTIDAATITFPITYILSDIFSEVYGYKWSRRVCWIAVILNFIFSCLILLSIKLPHPTWYDVSGFSSAIGGSMRIVIASCVSYVCGDFVNDNIFRYMKCRNEGLRGFNLRSIISSLAGEIVDTTLFVCIAFTFIVPANEMFPMIVISVILKTGYEVIILPITNVLVRKVESYECRSLREFEE